MALRIATRASNLALWQANFVASQLRQQTPSLEVEFVELTTSGDQRVTEPISALGGKGVFVKEIQRAVIDGRADIAVHSAKDLPSETPDELVLAAVPKLGMGSVSPNNSGYKGVSFLLPPGPFLPKGGRGSELERSVDSA